LFENVSDLDLKRYALRPVVGFIRNGNKIYKNAKVTFVSKFEGVSSVADTCYTDSAGMYKAYIKPGTYDIEVTVNNQKFVNRNQIINDGLKYNFYVTTKAAIREHVEDTVTFNNSENIYIRNSLVDNAGYPVKNAEIVVFDSTYVYAYAITNSDGVYKFSLKPGKYTVLIRSGSNHAKRTDITLTKQSGFASQLKNSNLFSKEAMICI
jgi:protocatechuate 3,4-dioxygenase beta subunit